MKKSSKKFKSFSENDTNSEFLFFEIPETNDIEQKCPDGWNDIANVIMPDNIPELQLQNISSEIKRSEKSQIEIYSFTPNAENKEVNQRNISTPLSMDSQVSFGKKISKPYKLLPKPQLKPGKILLHIRYFYNLTETIIQ